jgi:hypothetical protein
MLHPALVRVDLLKFPLLHAHDPLLIVKQNGTAAGGSLVKGKNIFGHLYFLLNGFISPSMGSFPPLYHGTPKITSTMFISRPT